MGEVYRARDTRLGRDVAVKVLPEALAKDEERLRRFEQEARILGALNHPNLLVIYDIGSESGISYLVSELLSGSVLRDLLTHPLGVRRATEYAVPSSVARPSQRKYYVVPAHARRIEIIGARPKRRPPSQANAALQAEVT